MAAPKERTVQGIVLWEKGWQGTLKLSDFMTYVDLARRLGLEKDLLKLICRRGFVRAED